MASILANSPESSFARRIDSLAVIPNPPETAKIWAPGYKNGLHSPARHGALFVASRRQLALNTLQTMGEISSKFAEALSRYARSTVMRDLAWLVAILISGTISASRFDAPPWFTFVLGVLTLLSILAYLALYIYFAFTDRDSLRSERYSIHKMAIEHGLLGDSTTGLKAVTTREILEIDPSATKTQDKKTLGP